jgi:Peptidase family M1 domain
LKKLISLSVILFFISDSFAQNKYWQQKTDYNISVTLNDADNSLTGFEQIDYYNNSPDTLNFIWIHLWPNAYKNDKTAFSDQRLENGSTDFYFSEENKKGYINQLNFKVDNVNAATEDHPQHQDIVKLLLPIPLAPGKSIKIETPFHVKLPYNFSRGGHVEQSYQITQWYPKPAVYDKTGWHEMPYLDQGEFYSEFGNFDVKITLPSNYIVAATGELQNEEEKKWLANKYNKLTFKPDGFELKAASKKNDLLAIPPSLKETKTIKFIQTNVHDFAWFADKRFNIRQDTLQLKSGRIINVYAYFLPSKNDVWRTSISMIKKSILSKSNWLGEYPYNVVSVVDDASNKPGGMEYPTITTLISGGSEANLERVINHEVGHNWFYGLLATNERIFPWMDEGMNTYYDKRYAAIYYDAKDGNRFVPKQKFIRNRMSAYPQKMILDTYIKLKKDQPINTASEKFLGINYGLSAYEKAGEWMMLLEQELNTTMFDSCMREYYRRWQFKHPSPEDFKTVMEEVSGKPLTNYFALLDKKGALEVEKKKQIEFTSFFNFKETDKYHYISVAPAVGYNLYDKLMVGALVHNYNLPPSNFQFVAAPLFATGTKKLNGLGRVEYSWFPKANGDKLTLSLAAAKFTGGSFKDSTGKENPLQFSKLLPSLKYVFANKNPRSLIKRYVQFKSFLISETNLSFTRDFVTGIDIITYPKAQRYVNQLQVGIENNRALYPYDATFQAEQGDGFVRLNITGNYHFNYQKGGGLDVRFFAGKFIYTGDKSFTTQYKTYPYHLNMSGPKGDEDYTYQNYFVGRSKFEGFASQQIMNRDGFFKVRTDLLSDKVGRTDDWLSAVNLVTDIPDKINILNALPIKIPVRIFVDIGTYAEAWKKSSTTGRFLYDAGFQLSLFKNVLNVYVPVIYSKVYGDYFKSTIIEKRFQRNISFSIDLQQLKFSKLFPQAGL